MKIVHPKMFVTIDFSVNNCYSLTIENTSEFYDKTRELHNQINNGYSGNFVMSELNEMDIKKHCLFVYDYYSDILNCKKTTSIVNSTVNEILKHDDFIEDFSVLNSTMLKLNSKIAEQLDYNITFSEDFTFDNFIKFSNYKINFAENDLLNNLLTLIQIACQSSIINTIICVNLMQVVTEQELDAFVKQIKYMQLNLLLIDSCQKYKLKNVENIIIDNDLCVIWQ